MLQHENPQYRALAAEALGEIGESSDLIINALESLKEDKDKNVIKTVEWSLSELNMKKRMVEDEN